MPISISGDGTITGVAVGGLPDGCVDQDMIASSVRVGLVSQQVFTSSGTWTKPTGIKTVKVYVTGGGGAGSGVAGNQLDDSGQGGSAGGTAIKIIDVSSISSVMFHNQLQVLALMEILIFMEDIVLHQEVI